MQKVLNEHLFFFLSPARAPALLFLRTLATQLFRVGNQRAIDFHPVALVSTSPSFTGRL
jgi:hypothetical protein